MKKILKHPLLLCLLLLSTSSYALEKPNILFTCPCDGKSNFWETQIKLMESTAKALNIDLKIERVGTNWTEFYNKSVAVIKSNKYKYLLLPPIGGSPEYILKEAADHKMKVFVFNAKFLTNENQKVIGEPRDKFKNFIGYFTPTDLDSGKILAKTLINTVLSKRAESERNNPLEIVAITGNKFGAASFERIEGLKQVIAEYKNITLSQFVHTNYTRAEGERVAKELITRYPKAEIIFAASDGLAIGAYDYLKQSQLDKKIITGGIDWSEAGIKSVQNNEITTSVGGHIFDGPESLIYLYDYHNGADFKKAKGLSFHSEFIALTNTDKEKLLKLQNLNLDEKIIHDFSLVNSKKANYQIDWFKALK